MNVIQIKDLPKNFNSILKEATYEGHGFLKKMEQDWITGVNRFDKNGEILLAVFDTTLPIQAIAIGGINIDPYLNDPSIGRVRHVYVTQTYRKSGLGKTLLEKLIAHSKPNFKKLRLRTSNPIAVLMYKNFGFVEISTNNDLEHTYLELSLHQ